MYSMSAPTSSGWVMSWNPSWSISLGRVAHDLAEGPVHPQPPAVEGDERHPDRRLVEGQAEPLLGLPQLRLPGARFG